MLTNLDLSWGNITSKAYVQIPTSISANLCIYFLFQLIMQDEALNAEKSIDWLASIKSRLESYRNSLEINEV